MHVCQPGYIENRDHKNAPVLLKQFWCLYLIILRNLSHPSASYPRPEDMKMLTECILFVNVVNKYFIF